MTNQLLKANNPGKQTALSAGAKRFASDIIRNWPTDEPFNAETALEGNPELRDHKSVLVDLAFEEFCQRAEAGQRIAASVFAKRFGRVEKTLLRLIEVDQFFQENSNLLTGLASTR